MSGQNVAIVALGIVGLAWVLAIGRLGAQLLAIVGILGYASAVGWEPSVARATVAGTVAATAVLASRRSDGWHALALGALVLLGWRPSTVLEPGFQLSFVAVAAILATMPALQRQLAGYPPAVRPLGWVGVAAACGVATAPVVWLHFGTVAAWTVPANVAAEPAMPLVLGLALAAALVEPVLPGAAASLVWLAGEAAAWIAGCARLFARLPQVEAHGGVVVAATLAALATALLLARLAPFRRRAALLAGSSLAVVALGVALVAGSGPAWRPPDGLRVTFLDVGQGDAVLLEVPAGAVLVDQGPPEARVAHQLRRRGIHALSALVLTHPQRDHVGGAAEVVRSVAVDRVLDPGLRVSSPDRHEAMAAARGRGVGVVVARAGDVFHVGRLELRVLWPADAGAPGDDPNDNALVVLARFGAVELLLTADAESNVTSRLPLRAVEVLKVAHHGSEDPGLLRLLRVLRPQVAVISVGDGNPYGHPRAETLAALDAVPGLRVWRTDTDGAIVVESDGRAVAVSSERRLRPRRRRVPRALRSARGGRRAAARVPDRRQRPPEGRDRDRPLAPALRAGGD